MGVWKNGDFFLNQWKTLNLGHLQRVVTLVAPHLVGSKPKMCLDSRPGKITPFIDTPIPLKPSLQFAPANETVGQFRRILDWDKAVFYTPISLVNFLGANSFSASKVASTGWWKSQTSILNGIFTRMSSGICEDGQLGNAQANMYIQIIHRLIFRIFQKHHQNIPWNPTSYLEDHPI